jgi:hypothetical protein
MVARSRVGIRFSYWPARLHNLAELIPFNQFLGSLKVKNTASVQELRVYWPQPTYDNNSDRVHINGAAT